MSGVGGGETNVRSVRNPGSTESANAEQELLESSDAATDVGVGNFRLVKRDDHRREAATDVVSSGPGARHGVVEDLPKTGEESATP